VFMRAPAHIFGFMLFGVPCLSRNAQRCVDSTKPHSGGQE